MAGDERGDDGTPPEELTIEGLLRHLEKPQQDKQEDRGNGDDSQTDPAE